MNKILTLKYSLFAIVILTFISSCFIYNTSPIHKTADGNFEIPATILIRDSIRSVYYYMSSSANAANWSSYIHHISLLKGEDGALHSVRRCFKNGNEKGIQWDEEILLVDSFKTRRLSIYDAKGFPIYVSGLVTEQRYDKKESATNLSVVLILPSHSTWVDKIKFYIGAYKVKSIFKANLKNIKRNIEQ